MNADKHRFIEAVAVCAAALRDADLPDDDGAFTDVLRMLDRDAHDWIANGGADEWRTYTSGTKSGTSSISRIASG